MVTPIWCYICLNISTRSATPNGKLFVLFFPQILQCTTLCDIISFKARLDCVHYPYLDTNKIPCYKSYRVKPILKSNSLVYKGGAGSNLYRHAEAWLWYVKMWDVLIHCRGELVTVMEKTELLIVVIIILGVMSISYNKLHITTKVGKLRRLTNMFGKLKINITMWKKSFLIK